MADASGRLPAAPAAVARALKPVAVPPAGQPLRLGDAVRLRAGVDETSSRDGPVGQVLSRDGVAPMPGGRPAVGCRD